MNTSSVRSSIAALLVLSVLTMSGCGSGDNGPAGPAGPAGPPGSSGVIHVGSNAATNPSVINANAAAWEALDPIVTVTGVTIASPPVVNFTVTDAFGRPLVGLGNKSKSGTAKFDSLVNLSFTLAKLVPGSGGAPSRWVSYIVTSVETNAAQPLPQRPGSDNTGTLVDNGDGSYRYTFYRDIPGTQAAVVAMAASAVAANANNNIADLGNLSYEPNLPHRLVIQLSGFAPGTGAAGENGINTPNGVSLGVAGVPLRKPQNAIHDFIPATGAKVTAADPSREVVANANCEACHRKLLGIPGLSAAEDSAMVHGGARNNVQYCVTCHTDQRKYGRAEAAYDANTLTLTGTATKYRVDGRAVFDFPNMIHKYHMGPLLAKKNYVPNFAHTTYPQDIRNCTSCHDGSTTPSRTTKTKDGNNWKSVPSANACGACHDGINFATGVGVRLRDAQAGLTSTNLNNTGLAHGGGAQPNDSQCNVCHKATGTFEQTDIDLNHFPVTPPSLSSALHVAGGSANTNSAYIASGASVGRLPLGSIKVTYDIKSVSRSAEGRPVMVFRMLQDGAAVPLNDFATVAADAVTGKKEIWPNFMGAPSLYWAFAVPQDGIAAPADVNATINIYLRCLWDGTAGTPACGASTAGVPSTAPGTLVAGAGADAGYYVATLTGATIPAEAVMLTGGMGYSYNVRTAMPLTQTNAAGFATAAPTAPVGATDLEAAANSTLYPNMPNRTGGLIVIAPNVQKVATGYTGRRAIVEDARCNACHQELGTFTEEAFHGGQRNDGTTCSWCHTPNRTSSGWSIDSTHFVHAIHARAKRQVPFTYQATTANPLGFAEIGYPGILNDCETCHLPGTYDFTATANANAAGQGADQLDKRQYRTVGTGTYAAVTPSLSPFVQPPYASVLGTAYGSGFSFNQFTGAATQAAATTLVMSPTVAVCSSCHNTADAISHFKINGAAYYQPRSTAIAGTNETCLICHGAGRTADIKVMHSKNR
jgi:OmcA/MtrC family decaheme c-type cytochrome